MVGSEAEILSTARDKQAILAKLQNRKTLNSTTLRRDSVNPV
jgi:hypothetical protein